MNRIRSHLEIVWEIPLALLSFLFYKVTRFCIQQLVRVHASLNKKQAGEWRVLCAQMLQEPMTLPALMTSGPRWNTHAIIALVGPLPIKKSIRLHAAAATKSAKSWTVVVHRSPGHQIVASVGSLSLSSQEPWQSMQLEPGEYWLALRYYQWSESVELPAVQVDGVEIVPAAVIPANINDFYHDLEKRNNLFYLCLHYYVCTLLRYRKWWPDFFVEREYLPAGNPQTEFYYGFLKTGESLAFALARQLRKTHDIYFTLYNRASFPILWYPLQEDEHTTPPSPGNSSYLVRVHKKSPSQEPFVYDWVQIRVCSPQAVSSPRKRGA